MRTTLTIDDQLAEQLKQMARDSGLSFKQVANNALRLGLRGAAQPQSASPNAFERADGRLPALPSWKREARPLLWH